MLDLTIDHRNIKHEDQLDLDLDPSCRWLYRTNPLLRLKEMGARGLLLVHLMVGIAKRVIPYSGYFSRGVYFADFVQRAQFINFRIESGCGQLECSVLPLCFEEGLATF